MTAFLMLAIYSAAIALNCVTIYPATSHIRRMGWPALACIAALIALYVGAITFIPLGALALVDLATDLTPESDLYIYARDVFFTANMALAFFALALAAWRAGKKEGLRDRSPSINTQ